MKIIAGLGNPGKKHIMNRHNLGFMLIDALTSPQSFQNKYNSHIHKMDLEGEKVLLIKPQTFMNRSGKAIREVMHFYKTPLENLLVIQDDKDQVFGKMKFQKSRGDGGHNGIKNIHQELQTKDYCRLKMGIAPSRVPFKSQKLSEEESLEDQESSSPMQTKTIKETHLFVLSPFNSEEQKQLPHFLQQGLSAVRCFVKKGYELSANEFNSNNQNI